MPEPDSSAAMPDFSTTDERNRWPRGIVRHLRLDPEAPLDAVSAIRVEHDGGLKAGGTVDIVYTLVVHPKHAEHVDRYRRLLEGSSALGGLFSPEPDADA